MKGILSKQNIAAAVFIGMLILAFLIVLPYFTAILSALVLAILVNPVYRLLKQKTKLKTASAVTVTILTALIIILPFAAVIQVVIAESLDVYSSVNTYLSEQRIQDSEFGELLVLSEQYLPSIQEVVSRTFSFIITTGESFLLSLPARVISFFIMVFLLYFFLVRQEEIIKYAHELLPFKKGHNMYIMQRIKQVVQGVLYGALLTAAVQAFVATIGYTVIGLETPVFLGVLTFIAALIPFIGTGLVWVPASVYLVITNLDTGMWWLGLVLFLYGALVVGTIDNFLRPFFVGDNAKIHPAIAIIGIFGGLELFGFVGIVVGPLFLALLNTLLDLYKDKKLV